MQQTKFATHHCIFVSFFVFRLFAFEMQPLNRQSIEMQLRVVCWFAAVILFFAAALNLPAQGNSISYQGRLISSGAAANANYDLRFAVFDAPTNGNVISFTLTNFNVPVSNGLFSVSLDFGPGVFNGT